MPLNVATIPIHQGHLDSTPISAEHVDVEKESQFITYSKNLCLGYPVARELAVPKTITLLQILGSFDYYSLGNTFDSQPKNSVLLAYSLHFIVNKAKEP